MWGMIGVVTSKITNKHVLNVVLLIIVISFIFVSYNIPKVKIIAYIDSYKNIHYTDEFMSGGEDFVPFAIGSIIFLPLCIELLISIILRREKFKTRQFFLFFCIGLQLHFLYIWVDSANLLLNLLYGSIFLKIWILCFILLCLYFLLSFIYSLKYFENKNNDVRK
jgi:hypothetical protein